MRRKYIICLLTVFSFTAGIAAGYLSGKRRKKSAGEKLPSDADSKDTDDSEPFFYTDDPEDLQLQWDLMTDSEQYLIKAIGKTGLSGIEELAEKGKVHFPKEKKTSAESFKKAVYELLDDDLFPSVLEISDDLEPGSNRDLYYLSRRGKKLYEYITGEEPAESEIFRDED